MEGGRNGSFAYNHPSSHMAYEGRLYDGIQKSHWKLQKVVSHPILFDRLANFRHAYFLSP